MCSIIARYRTPKQAAIIPTAACYVEWSVLRVSCAHHWLHSTAHDLSECSHSMVQLVLVLLVTSVLGGYQQDLGQSYV